MHATNRRFLILGLGRGLLNYEQFSQTRCNLRRANENPMFRKAPDQKPGTLRSQDWFDNPDKPRLDH